MKAIEVTVDRPLADVELAVRAALKDQGFGVLTEIDVAATLKDKLGVDRAALRILGACNPGFADRALTIDPSVSLLLPCNVVLESVDGGTHVAIADPRDLMPGVEFAELAAEAAGQLVAVIDALGGD
jgi:uncharacterized protein (DUF302 family)